jgi:uncharacterized protein with HEPN domain
LPRNERLYLSEIKQAISRIRGLVANRGDLNSDVVQAAVFWHLIVIGEAVRNLPDDLQDLEPEIEWGAIVAMRNVLVHAYFGIELERVWRTVAFELPILEAAVDRLLETTRCEHPGRMRIRASTSGHTRPVMATAHTLCRV